MPCRALCAGARWELFRTGALRCGCLQATRPLIRFLGGWEALGLCAGQPVTDPGGHQPEVSGVGAQVTDLGARPPRLFVSVRPGSRAAY